MRLILLAAVLLSVVDLGLTARILAVFPFPGKSHFIFLSSVMKTLTKQGHEVVEYSPFPPSKPPANYTHIRIESGLEKLLNTMTYEDFMMMSRGSSNLFGFIFFFGMVHELCEDTLKNEHIQKLLKSKEHFDLVFAQSTFLQESMVVFGQKFKAPVISLQTFSPVSSLNMDAGNALSLAHITDRQGEVTDQLSFSERMTNFMSASLRLSFYYLYALPKHDELIKKYYRQDLPPLVDQITNISLYLVNAHPYIDYIQPYTPNIIPVAGINISPERSSLPQDLEKFMDEAKEGVVYFSLGSVFPTHSMPKEVLQMFINAFGKLKQRVLWKIESESLPGLSENVKLSKWVPQPGILAHPNCVLFITHGRLFSQLEALHAGVPTVGIPIFADHMLNVVAHPNCVLFITHGGLFSQLEALHAGVPTVGIPIFADHRLNVAAHPNCVLFITHGGLFSQLEALHAGVPTVGIPILADQPFNVKFSEHRGFGVKLDFATLSEDTISTAVNTVLLNPKYRENAKRLSQIFRDRPVSPADSVVFWVEYVLRHAGAHHLRPASTRLSWYQLALLDVLAAVLLPPLIFIVVLAFVVRKMCSSPSSKKVPKSKKTD